MTKIKNTECGETANKGATKPGVARQASSERKPAKVTRLPKKAAGSKAASGALKTYVTASTQPVTVNAAKATEAAPAKPKTTKQEQVLTMLSQAGGVTINEIMKATGWQQHSVRGFFAGTVRKKLGYELTSDKREGADRRYAIKFAA